MPQHPDTVTLEGFRGINNRVSPERLTPEELAKAINVDVDSTGAILMRRGFEQIYNASNPCRNLWSSGDDCFFTEGTRLKKLRTDNSIEDLSVDFTRDAVQNGVTYQRLQDTIYILATDKGYVQRPDGTITDFGIDAPPTRASLSAVAGSMPEGRYQVTYSFITESGRESGTTRASYIDLDSEGGIQVSNMSVSSNPEVTHKVIYITPPNEETFYEVMTLNNNISSIQVLSYKGVRPLKTHMLSKMVTGNLSAIFNGRLYVVRDNLMFFSEPFDYERINFSKNYRNFPSKITAIMEVEDGIFVAADKLYFLRGDTPEEMTLRMIDDIKVMRGSPVVSTGGDITLENIPTGYKWLFLSNKGVMLGGNGGLLFSLTEKRLAIGFSDEGGASMMRYDDGLSQYVSLLKNPENNRMRVGDSATAEIIRNGETVSS